MPDEKLKADVEEEFASDLDDYMVEWEADLRAKLSEDALPGKGHHVADANGG